MDNDKQNKLDAFTEAYIECALWSSSETDIKGRDFSLYDYYNMEDISNETLTKMIEDCFIFQEKCGELINDNSAGAGHDFWLSRNGHGANFLDGDYTPEVAEKLMEVSDDFGEYNLYVGDDDLIYA